MKKKRLKSKLHLSRETVRRLNPQELTGLVGGGGSGSEFCTQAEFCTVRTGNSDGGQTYCICPNCPDHTDGCTGTGPIYTGPFYPGCG